MLWWRMTWRISTFKINIWLWHDRVSTRLTWIYSSRLYRLWLNTLFKTLDLPYHSIRSCNRHSHGIYILSFYFTRLPSIVFYHFLYSFYLLWCIDLLIHQAFWLAWRCPSQPWIWHIYMSSLDFGSRVSFESICIKPWTRLIQTLDWESKEPIF